MKARVVAWREYLNHMLGAKRREMDRPATEAVVEPFADAWNQRDAYAFAALFAAKLHLLARNPRTRANGGGETSRAAVHWCSGQRQSSDLLAPNGPLLKPDIVQPGVVVADIDWEMTGAGSLP
jgi:hypothetical protein